MPLPTAACSDSADGLLPRLICRCEMLRCKPSAPASAVGDDPRCELDRDGPCLHRVTSERARDGRIHMSGLYMADLRLPHICPTLFSSLANTLAAAAVDCLLPASTPGTLPMPRLLRAPTGSHRLAATHSSHSEAP